MSTNTNNNASAVVTTTAPALPDPKTAHDVLFGLQTRAFFQKLAAAGRTPRTEKEAEQLLTLAGKLRLAEQHPAYKAAAAPDSLSESITALDKLMGQDKAAADVARRSVARELVQYDDIYNSVLSLKAAEATAIADKNGLLNPDGSFKAAA